MERLIVLVEGETEEDFANDVRAPHLYQSGYSNVSARLLGNARQRFRRGGIRGWSSARTDIVRHLRADQGIMVALMVDYYALPRSGGRAWPGRAESAGASVVENALLQCIRLHMGHGFDRRRFIPCVMMHEFEAMLFSDCQTFAETIGCPKIADKLLSIRHQFATPEAIDDTPEGAPSKRITKLVPGYQKPLMGIKGVLGIGLERIRGECPHFRIWLERLEAHGRNDHSV